MVISASEFAWSTTRQNTSQLSVQHNIFDNEVKSSRTFETSGHCQALVTSQEILEERCGLCRK